MIFYQSSPPENIASMKRGFIQQNYYIVSDIAGADTIGGGGGTNICVLAYYLHQSFHRNDNQIF